MRHGSLPKSSQYFRGIKFALIGWMGICVQLTVLAILTRAGMNYLVATAIAVESAVIHNFCWHRRFTWQDRTASSFSGDLPALLRFHLSNGVVSLLGNVLLMSLLVQEVGLPITAANICAIATCAIANFLLSDLWVFKNGRNSP